MARNVARDDGRTIPEWERSVRGFVFGFGVATVVLAIITVALGVDARFYHPGSAGAMIGPGVGMLLSFLGWGVTLSLLRMWRQADREFYERLHRRRRSSGYEAR